ncbi:MAG: acyl-CoA dehydrogenase family protein [Alphaproteobacteria bacterium]|nr:acyl-CoA dehydrogenase family protein [Alphaproteobacteria bacterium]
MDLNYSEIQEMLKDSVERFVRDNYAFEQRRQIVESGQGFSRQHWQTYAELGWLGAALPEDVGGLGGGGAETMVVMEGLGRGLALEPMLGAVVLGGGLINAAGNEAQRRELLPALIGGELLLSFAFAEPGGRFDLSHTETRAEAAGGGWRLSGRKCVVLHGAAADRFIVPARTSGEVRDAAGITLFLVANDSAGLTRRDYATVDALPASDLTFDGLELAAEDVLGEVGGAYPHIEGAIDAGIAASCADAVGAMAAAVDITNEYIQGREQFGQSIGRFQVLQHRLVDMFMECERARSMAVMAALKLDTEADERRRAMAAAKSLVGRAAKFVAAQGVQLHGGMGMTEEYPIGHYFKRLMTFDTMFGNSDYHADRFVAQGDQS